MASNTYNITTLQHYNNYWYFFIDGKQYVQHYNITTIIDIFIDGKQYVQHYNITTLQHYNNYWYVL